MTRILIALSLIAAVVWIALTLGCDMAPLHMRDECRAKYEAQK